MLYEFFEVEFNVLDGFEPKKQWPKFYTFKMIHLYIKVKGTKL
jgi:hypothetical protein